MAQAQIVEKLIAEALRQLGPGDEFEPGVVHHFGGVPSLAAQALGEKEGVQTVQRGVDAGAEVRRTAADDEQVVHVVV